MHDEKFDTEVFAKYYFILVYIFLIVLLPLIVLLFLGTIKTEERTVQAVVYPEVVSEDIFGSKKYSVTFTYAEDNDEAREYIYVVSTKTGRDVYYRFKDSKEAEMILKTVKHAFGGYYELELPY